LPSDAESLEGGSGSRPFLIVPKPNLEPFDNGSYELLHQQKQIPLIKLDITWKCAILAEFFACSTQCEKHQKVLKTVWETVSAPFFYLKLKFFSRGTRIASFYTRKGKRTGTVRGRQRYETTRNTTIRGI